MSRKKKHTEFMIVRMKHDFFGVMLPKGAVCGRYTYTYRNGKSECVTYILADFKPFVCGGTCHYNIWIKSSATGHWFKTQTTQRFIYRKLAEMLSCNLYLNNLHKFNVSLHLDIEQEADHEEILSCAPHVRKVRQYI